MPSVGGSLLATGTKSIRGTSENNSFGLGYERQCFLLSHFEPSKNKPYI